MPVGVANEKVAGGGSASLQLAGLDQVGHGVEAAPTIAIVSLASAADLANLSLCRSLADRPARPRLTLGLRLGAPLERRPSPPSSRQASLVLSCRFRTGRDRPSGFGHLVNTLILMEEPVVPYLLARAVQLLTSARIVDEELGKPRGGGCLRCSERAAARLAAFRASRRGRSAGPAYEGRERLHQLCCAVRRLPQTRPPASVRFLGLEALPRWRSIVLVGAATWHDGGLDSKVSELASGIARASNLAGVVAQGRSATAFWRRRRARLHATPDEARLAEALIERFTGDAPAADRAARPGPLTGGALPVRRLTANGRPTGCRRGRFQRRAYARRTLIGGAPHGRGDARTTGP